MTLRTAIGVLATALCLAASASARTAPASAQAPAAAPSVPARRAAAHAAPAPGTLALGRALDAQRRHDARGVIAALDTLDFAHARFAGADRAAFLLAQACLASGERARFDALAASLAGRTDAASRWIAIEAALLGGGASDADARARVLVRSDDALGRDLAGASRLDEATRAIAAGGDPDAILARVPAESRAAARALHLRGLAALERGDAARGVVFLSRAFADTTYGARREAGLALAGALLDAGRWDEARAIADAIDRDWSAQQDALARARRATAFDDVWASWLAAPDSAAALPIDAHALLAQAARAAEQIADGAECPEPPAASAPARATPALRVALPARERWDEVAAASRTRDEARGALARAERAAAAADAALADRRRYLVLGADSLRRADQRMAPRQATLDSLRARLEELDRALRSVRDEEARRVARRTAALLAACERQDAWARGLRHTYVAGPDSARFGRSPAGLPSGAATLAAESELTAALRALVERIAASAPGWLQRSYEQAWAPNIEGRIVAQAETLARQREWARVLGTSLDSSLAHLDGADDAARLRANVAALARRADSLDASGEALRAAVAREAIDRTQAALAREREGIDYLAATARWAQAVRPDTGAALATRVTRGADSTDTDVQESPETIAARAAALPALRAFLALHPRSAARGEMRFRLADLELSAARQAFREKMAVFVKRTSEGRGAGLAVPVLDPAAALALYRAILAEDPDYPHLDAVRFDAGMILAESGAAAAERDFETLVTTWPGSAYAQESWLRMGDLAFDAKRFRLAAERYAHAGDGADPTLAAIARYKRGWSHFNQDQFADAAAAFRSVLDLYAGSRTDVHVDLADEADDYLVNALAAAGGAPAFAALFDGAGARAYEPHVLMELGQQLRRWGRLADAAAADAMVIQRWPESPDALLAAQREIATWHRAENAEREHEAVLAHAPRFAPGGAWARAQRSDSLRAAGEAFAHDAWLADAHAFHAKARTTGAAEAWRRALEGYATVLRTWPRDPRAAVLELDAGEAATHLGDRAAALDWYAAAARDGRDSVAAMALVQRVAVTDAWYESTRAGRASGADTLARAVLAAGDRLVQRFPDHARAADVTWRQAQLSLAHGWTDRAAEDLDRLVTRHPSDTRAPLAASQRADVLFGAGRFDDAGAAFERALAVARAQGRDSLARAAERALPVCAYRAAEASVAADSNAYATHAARFEAVAVRFPSYERAPLARYRAAIAFERAGKPREEVRVLRTLIDAAPRGPLAHDARLRVAQALERLDEKTPAAEAWLEFSRTTPDRADAGAAWLKAADLVAAARDTARADALRLEYVRTHPGDVESAMAILEEMARRELATVSDARPVSTLLPATSRARRAAAPASRLASYLALAAAHPKLASRELIAHVRFLQGEEARGPYASLRLAQPLAKSVGAKKAALDTLLARYRRAADLGVAEWAHAAAFRIGESLEGFADALRASEPPADLAGDDLAAYRNVLEQKAALFASRGEDVWSELLRRLPADARGDAWTTQAREALNARLARRFLFRPEFEFPLVDADGPERARVSDATRTNGAADGAPATDTARTLARRQGAPR